MLNAAKVALHGLEEVEELSSQVASFARRSLQPFQSPEVRKGPLESLIGSSAALRLDFKGIEVKAFKGFSWIFNEKRRGFMVRSFFKALYEAYHEKVWLLSIDFHQVLESAIRELFEAERLAAEDWEQLLHTAYELNYEEKRLYPMLFQLVKSTYDERHSVITKALDLGRSKAYQANTQQAESFLKHWMQATVEAFTNEAP